MVVVGPIVDETNVLVFVVLFNDPGSAFVMFFQDLGPLKALCWPHLWP
jgi:hypothetical protein